MTYNKEWYAEYAKKNREKLNKTSREWAKKNREKRQITENKWRKENPDKIKAHKHKEYLKHRVKYISRSKKYYAENKGGLDKLHKISSKKYYKKNKDKITKYIKQWNLENKGRMSQKQKEWVNKNRDKVNYNANKNMKKRRLANISYRISQNIGSDIWHALKDKKYSIKWQSLVGYTTEDLIKHLENQFDVLMSWNNYGSYWNIDHKKPRSLFKFKSHKDKEFKECWALKNLQPLEKIANIKKGKKYVC